MKRTVICAALVLAVVFLVPAGASAQNKVQQCASIQVDVDYKAGNANWENSAMVLKLQDQGEGWLTVDSNKANRAQIKAAKGETFRLNFNDGSHMVNVNASGGAHLKASAGNKPSTVIVEVTGNSGSGVLKFDITGSPNENAKINGCPGGNVYFNIVG